VNQGNIQDRAEETVFQKLGRTGGGPIEVGQLALDPAGELDARPHAYPVAFQFVYHGVAFRAELEADPAEPLRLSAVVGVLPFSAETPLGRRAVAVFLNAARPPRGQFTLTRDGRLHAAFAAPVQRPRTPVHVVATVISLVLEIRPYLEILAALRALR
jgi:hypothetical protein